MLGGLGTGKDNDHVHVHDHCCDWNVNVGLWNCLEPKEFMESCQLGIEHVQLELENGKEIPFAGEVPPIILEILDKFQNQTNSFHPVTFLHLINSIRTVAGRSTKNPMTSAPVPAPGLVLRRILSEFWLDNKKGNYLIPILLGLSLSKSTRDKELNTRNYLNQIFQMVEFLLQNPKTKASSTDNQCQEPIVELLIRKIETVLRALTIRIEGHQGECSSQKHNQTEVIVDTGPLATFISRLVLRYGSSTSSANKARHNYNSHRHEPDPEPMTIPNAQTQLITSFCSISSQSYCAQRLISRILFQLPLSIQQKLFISWFSFGGTGTQNEDKDFGNPKFQLFYPPSAFLNSNPTAELLLTKIPLTTPIITSKFWTNWAKYLTSEPHLFPLNKVWTQFTSNYFEFIHKTTTRTSCSTMEILLQIQSSTLAFVSLARCLKLVLKSRMTQFIAKDKDNDIVPLQNIHQLMPYITQLMESPDAMIHDISLVLASVIWDLEHESQSGGLGTGDEGSKLQLEFEPNATSSTGIYGRLMGFYKTGIIPPEGEFFGHEQLKSQLQIVDSKSSRDEGNTKNFQPVPEEQIARLRSAGLIPTSFQNVHDVFVGQTKGKDDHETEVLRQLATIRIPILLRSGLRPDGTVVTERIIRTLIEQADDNNDNEDDEEDDSKNPKCKASSPMGQIARQALLELGLFNPTSLATVFHDTVFNGKNHSIGDKIRIIQLVQGFFTCSSLTGAMDHQTKSWITQMEPKYLAFQFKDRIAIGLPSSSSLPADSQTQVQIKSKSNSKDSDAIVRTTSLESKSKTRRWGHTARKHNNQIANDSDNGTIEFKNQLQNTETKSDSKSQESVALASALWSHAYQGLRVGENLLNSEFDQLKGSVDPDGPTLLLLITKLQFLNSLVPHVTSPGTEREAVHLVQIYANSSQCSSPQVRLATWKILHDLLVCQSFHLGIPTAQFLNDNPQIQAQLFQKYLQNEQDSNIVNLIKTTQRLISYYQA